MSTSMRQQPSCFDIPRSYHSLMVKLDTSEQVVTLSSPDGLTFYAWYKNIRTGELLPKVEINLQPDAKVYFVASEFEGWYYICQWSEYFKRFGCSCHEGKQRLVCEHPQLLPR